MRVSITAEASPIVSDQPTVLALITAIEAIECTETACELDALYTISDKPKITTLILTIGSNPRRFVVPIADLTEQTIPKICEFVSQNRNA